MSPSHRSTKVSPAASWWLFPHSLQTKSRALDRARYASQHAAHALLRPSFVHVRLIEDTTALISTQHKLVHVNDDWLSIRRQCQTEPACHIVGLKGSRSTALPFLTRSALSQIHLTVSWRLPRTSPYLISPICPLRVSCASRTERRAAARATAWTSAWLGGSKSSSELAAELLAPSASATAAGVHSSSSSAADV